MLDLIKENVMSMYKNRKPTNRICQKLQNENSATEENTVSKTKY